MRQRLVSIQRVTSALLAGWVRGWAMFVSSNLEGVEVVQGGQVGQVSTFVGLGSRSDMPPRRTSCSTRLGEKLMPCRNTPCSALPLSTWGQTRAVGALQGQFGPMGFRVSQVGRGIKARPGANAAVVTSVSRGPASRQRPGQKDCGHEAASRANSGLGCRRGQSGRGKLQMTLSATITPPVLHSTAIVFP